MKRYLLAAVAALAIGGAANAQLTSKLQFQPPTATEFFQLQSECAKLGQKKLKSNNASGYNQTMSSRYSSEDGRCYVAIYAADTIIPNHRYSYLYDGQSDELLAVTGVTEDGAKWGEMFPDRKGDIHAAAAKDYDYDPVSEYIASKAGSP